MWTEGMARLRDNSLPRNSRSTASAPRSAFQDLPALSSSFLSPAPKRPEGHRVRHNSLQRIPAPESAATLIPLPPQNKSHGIPHPFPVRSSGCYLLRCGSSPWWPPEKRCRPGSPRRWCTAPAALRRHRQAPAVSSHLQFQGPGHSWPLLAAYMNDSGVRMLAALVQPSKKLHHIAIVFPIEIAQAMDEDFFPFSVR